MVALTLIACVTSPPASGPLATAEDGSKSSVVWLADYSDGRLLARETGKPMLVVFR